MAWICGAVCKFRSLTLNANLWIRFELIYFCSYENRRFLPRTKKSLDYKLFFPVLGDRTHLRYLSLVFQTCGWQSHCYSANQTFLSHHKTKRKLVWFQSKSARSLNSVPHSRCNAPKWTNSGKPGNRSRSSFWSLDFMCNLLDFLVATRFTCWSFEPFDDSRWNRNE